MAEQIAELQGQLEAAHRVEQSAQAKVDRVIAIGVKKKGGSIGSWCQIQHGLLLSQFPGAQALANQQLAAAVEERMLLEHRLSTLQEETSTTNGIHPPSAPFTQP